MTNAIVHPDVRTQLDNFASNKPHAIIISGKKGSGVSDIAKELAENIGPVLAVIRPKKRQPNSSYKEDYDNGTIIIDDIRELYERTRSKFTSPQVVIIDFGNRTMTPQAQNAFLKLLEEPQAQIHFILATHYIDRLLPTVLSRCQRLHVRPITPHQTADLLESLSITDPVRRARIQYIADGLPAEMQRLANDEAYYEQRVATVQDAKALLEGDGYIRLKVIHAYKDKRSAALQLIDDTIHQLQLALKKTHQASAAQQIDVLIYAHDRIVGNGNIQLQLAKALL